MNGVLLMFKDGKISYHPFLYPTSSVVVTVIDLKILDVRLKSQIGYFASGAGEPIAIFYYLPSLMRAIARPTRADRAEISDTGGYPGVVLEYMQLRAGRSDLYGD